MRTRKKVHSLYRSLQRSTPLTEPASSALASTQPSLLRRSATTTAIAANFCEKQASTNPASQCSQQQCCLLACERPHSQRRLHTSPTRAAACCQVRPSDIFIDAPTRQQCAAHAPATEAATAPLKREDPIKTTRKRVPRQRVATRKTRICPEFYPMVSPPSNLGRLPARAR